MYSVTIQRQLGTIYYVSGTVLRCRIYNSKSLCLCYCMARNNVPNLQGTGYITMLHEGAMSGRCRLKGVEVGVGVEGTMAQGRVVTSPCGIFV